VCLDSRTEYVQLEQGRRGYVQQLVECDTAQRAKAAEAAHARGGWGSSTQKKGLSR